MPSPDSFSQQPSGADANFSPVPEAVGNSSDPAQSFSAQETSAQETFAHVDSGQPAGAQQGAYYQQAPQAPQGMPMPPTAQAMPPQPQDAFAQSSYQPQGAPYMNQGMPVQSAAGQTAPGQPSGQAPDYLTGQVPMYPTGQVPTYQNPTGQVPYPYPNATGQIPYPMPAGGPGYAAQPAHPSEFLLGLKQLWPSLALTWKSRLHEAFDRVLGMKLFWLVSFLAFSLFSALFCSFWFGRVGASGMNGVGRASADFMDSLGLGGLTSYQPAYLNYPMQGGWFLLFFLSFLGAFAIMALRALFIKALAGVRHAPLSYTAAANISGQGILSVTAILAGAFVLILIPSSGWLGFVTFLFWFLCIGAIFLNELILWVGLNKAISSEKELVIPHALLSLAWIACVVVLVTIFSMIFASTMVDAMF